MVRFFRDVRRRWNQGNLCGNKRREREVGSLDFNSPLKNAKLRLLKRKRQGLEETSEKPSKKCARRSRRKDGGRGGAREGLKVSLGAVWRSRKVGERFQSSKAKVAEGKDRRR